VKITPRAVSAMRLASVVSRRPDVDPRAVWPKLYPELRKQALIAPGATFLAAYLADALDGLGSMQWYGAAMTLQPEQRVAPPLEEVRVEAGAYAVGLHQGAYDGLPGAWGAFVRELKASGRPLDLTRPCLEIYLDDPSATPAEELRTELCVPVTG